jgi:hypothetical protein
LQTYFKKTMIKAIYENKEQITSASINLPEMNYIGHVWANKETMKFNLNPNSQTITL